MDDHDDMSDTLRSSVEHCARPSAIGEVRSFRQVLRDLKEARLRTPIVFLQMANDKYQRTSEEASMVASMVQVTGCDLYDCSARLCQMPSDPPSGVDGHCALTLNERTLRCSRRPQLWTVSGVKSMHDLCASFGERDVAAVANFEEDVEPEWTYQFREGEAKWAETVIFCSTWTFQRGAPSNLMELLMTGILQRLGEIGGADRHELEHLACFRSSMVVVEKVLLRDYGTQYTKPVRVPGELLVALVDQDSDIFVGSHGTRDSRMQMLVVCAKGFVGSGGEPIRRGVYDAVLESIRTILAHDSVDFHGGLPLASFVCPSCLQTKQPRKAATWDVARVRSQSVAFVRCANGHRIDRNLICGDSREPAGAPCCYSTPIIGECVAFEWHRSVVIVAVVFSDERGNVGSGFVADSELGLILTAAHTMKPTSKGSDDSLVKEILVGVPRENDGRVEFCFAAEIAVLGSSNVDAVVLKVTSRGPGTSDVLPSDLPGLKLASESFRGEIVSFIGYNQEGEGVVPPASFVECRHDELHGRVCKFSKIPTMEGIFEEIVVDGGRVIHGHSGGPCLNARGEVLGILSRHDCYNGHRWYLVPYWKLRNDLQTAREMQAERNEAPERLRGQLGR
jgi:Trypsin-like peptidase domain